MKTTRVLLADDHPLIVAAVRSLLELIEGVRVVAEAADGHSAVELANTHRPDLAILDISMQGMNGLEATTRIRKALPATRVLILSSHVSEELVHRAIRAGASGYVSKGAGLQEIGMAIEAAARGEFYFGSEIAGHLVANLVKAAGTASPSALERLTPRQREVLQLIAEGWRTKEIAHRIGLSVKTVETHRAEIMRRLGINSVARLAIFGARHGLVPSSPPLDRGDGDA